MAGRGSLRLLIGLRLRDPASEEASRAARAVLEEAAGLEPSLRVPLHWNLSLRALTQSGSQKMTDLIAGIKARIKSCGDEILPLGFSGAPHPLLLREELEGELAWCRRNPWLRGFKALTGQEPVHILPMAPDLLREQVYGAYSRQGFRSVGVALPWLQAPRLFPKRGSYRFRLGGKEGRAAFFTVLLIGAREGPAGLPWERLAALIAALGAGGEPLFLLFDLEAWQGQSPLHPLLQALGHEPHFLSLDRDYPLKKAEKQEDIPPGLLLSALDPLALGGPLLREAAARVEPFRAKRRRTDADIRAVLEGMAGWKSAALIRPKARKKPAGGEQILTAAMTGFVSLDGPAFAAAFADGRFSGFQRRGSRLGLELPAASYLTLSGRRYSLSTESAFSFEREGETGLRTMLKARLPKTDGELRLLIDAYFRNGEEELALDFTLSFPELAAAAIEELAPFELALFSLGARERIRAVVELDGEGQYTEFFGVEAGEWLLYGSRFLFSSERTGPSAALSLAPGPHGPSGPLPLPLRVVSVRGRRLLLANPFGSYLPVPISAYSGRTERFSLRLGLTG